MRIAAFLIALAACAEDEPAAPPAPADVAPSSARAGTHVIRDLVKEASRLELRSGGLLIDLGTPDQHKYTGAFSDAQELSFSFYEWRWFNRIVLRARASKRTSLVVVLDDRVIGKRTVREEWRTLELPLARIATPGFHTVSIERAGDLEVDWIHFTRRKDRAPENLARVSTMSFGAPRHALVADPPRTLSFYFEVPEASRLIFDYAAEKGAEFSIYAREDGEKRRQLFSARGTPSWQEAVVDLSELANKVVRLDLMTDGEPQSAGWGEPTVVRNGPPPPVPMLSPEDHPRNLLVIVIDTLRQDAIAAFNPKTIVKTPRFSELAKESTIFTNAYATAPWTKPVVATILSGLHPSTHGAFTEEAMLPSDVPLLSEHLSARGYATALFSANGYVSDRFGFERGWDHAVNFPRERKKTQAEFVYRDVLTWIERQEKPFFAYVQTVDPHVPYQAPSRFLSLYFEGSYRGRLGAAVSGYEHNDFNDGKLRLTEQDRSYLVGQYYGEISYHDHYLGRFLDRLAELGILDETLLIVTNDHGEELFERGKLGHGQSLYEELIRSPLLVRAPAIFPAGEEVRAPVSLVDLIPTILETLGAEPMQEIEGTSLLGAVHDRPALVPPYAISERLDLERSVRLGDYKLILSLERAPLLFDLARDPGETDDLSSRKRIARRTLEIHLQEALAVPKALERTSFGTRRRRQAPTADIDPELREHLKALGYFNN